MYFVPRISNYILILIIFLADFLPGSFPTKELSIFEFNKLINTENYLYVLFYSSSNCKQCSKVQFTWQLLEKQLQTKSIPKLTVAQVDCTIHRDLCSREDINILPTIKFYAPINKFTIFEETYDSNEYDLVSLEEFLMAKIEKTRKEKPSSSDEPTAQTNDDDSDSTLSSIVKLKPKNGLYELTDDVSSLFLSEGQHFVNFYVPWCSHCQDLKPRWEVIAQMVEGNDKVKISQIDCSANIYTCKVQFKIKEYPTLLWISNGKVVARYKGANKLDGLKSFIDSQLTDYELNKLLQKYSDADADVEELEIDYRKKTSNVQSLNNDNFRIITDSPGFTFVHFTVPWSKHCRQMKSEWDKLSLRISNVKIAKVDCSINEKICTQEKIDGYPTIVLYKEGKRFPEYENSRTADALVEYLNKQISQTHTEL